MKERIGIIGAMREEIMLITREMQYLERKIYAGIRYRAGTIGNTKVVVVQCGIGKVNAAISTQILIDQFHVTKIIHTGIAGALDGKLSPLSLVAADRLTYHDVRMEQLETCFPEQAYFLADPALLNLLVSVCKEPIFVGTIASGDGFITDAGQKESIRSNLNALCIDMESAAVAHTAFINGIPFAVLRCISDFADEDSTDDYDKFETLAANKAAAVVLAALTQIQE